MVTDLKLDIDLPPHLRFCSLTAASFTAVIDFFLILLHGKQMFVVSLWPRNNQHYCVDVDVEKLRAQTYASMPASQITKYIYYTNLVSGSLNICFKIIYNRLVMSESIKSVFKSVNSIRQYHLVR